MQTATLRQEIKLSTRFSHRIFQDHHKRCPEMLDLFDPSGGFVENVIVICQRIQIYGYTYF